MGPRLERKFMATKPVATTPTPIFQCRRKGKRNSSPSVIAAMVMGPAEMVVMAPTGSISQGTIQGNNLRLFQTADWCPA